MSSMNCDNREAIDEEKEQIEDAIDLTIGITFLVSSFALGLAFFYYTKYNDFLATLGIISGGIWLNLFIGDLIKKCLKRI